MLSADGMPIPEQMPCSICGNPVTPIQNYMPNFQTWMNVASEILDKPTAKSARFAEVREALKGCPRDWKRKILFACGELLKGMRHEPKIKNESHFWTFKENSGRTSFAKKNSNEHES